VHTLILSDARAVAGNGLFLCSTFYWFRPELHVGPNFGIRPTHRNLDPIPPTNFSGFMDLTRPDPKHGLPIMETRRPASADRTAGHQFQATGQPVSRTQASNAMTSRLPRYEAKRVQRRCFQCGSVQLRSDIKGTELPPANIFIYSKGN